MGKAKQPPLTHELVLAAVRRRGVATTRQVAEDIGFDYSIVLYYLHGLVNGGKATRARAPNGGPRGARAWLYRAPAAPR